MANKASARKRARQTIVITARNRSRMNRIRTYLRRVERALATKDADAASRSFREAMPEVHRGVSKGVFHANTAARKLSRLSARIKRLSAPQ